MFGYDAAEMVGENVKRLMPPAYSHRHDSFIQNYVDTGVKKIIGIGRDVTGQHKSGLTFPVELSVGEAQTAHGRQFIGILRDLRPRRETQRRLNEVQNQLVHMARVSAMDEMGATLAHELNQPLTAAMLYLQTIERCLDKMETEGSTGKSATKARELLEKSVHEADRAGAIIRRLRQFVDRKEVDRQSCNLNDLIDDAVELASIGARGRGINVTIQHSGEPLPVHVDPIQIQQILINLVRNAVDAIQEHHGSHVKVIAHSDRGGGPGHAFVTVSDNGPGISASVLDDLFRAFATTKENGLGIGLAIAQSIAQNHGGELTATNKSGDGGAEFVLRLPLEDTGRPGEEKSS
ncbi:MAG: ATP-binding protein [Pseudomonadota bacterium]